MTLDDFIAELEKTPRDWRLSFSTSIRAGNPSLHCPLSAVATALGMPCGFGYPDIAAAALGLRDEWREIVRAADADCMADQALRARLLTACGLS